MSDNELEKIREEKKAELRAQAEGNGTETPAEPVPVDGEAALSSFVNEHDLVIVDFWAEWCGPCEMQKPILADLAAERDVAVATVDVDNNQPLAAQYGVRGIPALVVFANGEVVEQFTGVQQRDRLDRVVDRFA